ncbi:hypothetical protein FHW92_005130 [Novosphingobium sp. SG707]|nr:hypothetical protein [Novosphingobium sp. SG707]
MASAPTPISPPSGVNANLLGPLKSESFANDAVGGTGSYGAGNSGSASAGAATVAFSYDAASGTYTVSAGGTSQSFAPSAKSASGSNALSSVYIINGTTSADALTLTNPGTSGAFTYKYVGAGFWQHSSGSTGSNTTQEYAFTYGVATPGTAVPRTGQAIFSVDLLGALAKFGGTVSMNGSGTLAADFGSGSLTMAGTFSELDPVSGATIMPSANWSGQGTIASSSNAISGTMRTSPNAVSPYPTSLTGTFTGRFYGPSADEVGAAFSLTGSDGLELAAVGTLTGRQTTATGITGTGAAFYSLSGGGTTPVGDLRYFVDSTKTFTSAYTTIGAGGNYITFVKNANGSYNLSDTVSSAPLNFDSTNVISQNAVFTNYKTSVASGYPTDELTLFNPGAGNTTLALTYVSYGQWRSTSASTQVSDRAFIYGQLTGTGLMPTTGSATYTGIASGRGVGATSSTDAYTLSGTSRFDVNFGTASLTSSVSGTLLNTTTNASTALGTVSFSGNISNGAFTATTAPSASVSGQMAGAFFGPTASEVGAVFTLANNSGAMPYTIVGAAVAKRGP